MGTITGTLTTDQARNKQQKNRSSTRANRKIKGFELFDLCRHLQFSSFTFPVFKIRYWLFVFKNFPLTYTFIYRLTYIYTSYTSSFYFVLMQKAS